MPSHYDQFQNRGFNIGERPIFRRNPGPRPVFEPRPPRQPPPLPSQADLSRMPPPDSDLWALGLDINGRPWRPPWGRGGGGVVERPISRPFPLPLPLPDGGHQNVVDPNTGNVAGGLPGGPGSGGPVGSPIGGGPLFGTGLVIDPNTRNVAGGLPGGPGSGGGYSYGNPPSMLGTGALQPLGLGGNVQALLPLLYRLLGG